MRVLVTGSAGFIGFHVARALMARGDAVTGFDVVNDYYDVALKEARLAELEQDRGRDAARTGRSSAPISPTWTRSRPPSRARPSTG